MKINKENFDTFINKIVEIKGDLRFNKGAKDVNWKIPLPKTNEEFKKFTKKYYGVELNCKVVVLRDGITYEIKEKQSEYSKNSLYKLWDTKFGQYDGLKILLNSLFGDLDCGGVAGSHYGQTKLNEDRKEILLNWDEIDNSAKIRLELEEQTKSLKEIFG